jgi:hypothetical protein
MSQNPTWEKEVLKQLGTQRTASSQAQGPVSLFVGSKARFGPCSLRFFFFFILYSLVSPVQFSGPPVRGLTTGHKTSRYLSTRFLVYPAIPLLICMEFDFFFFELFAFPNCRPVLQLICPGVPLASGGGSFQRW